MTKTDSTISDLLSHGFTERMARSYVDKLEAENQNDMFDPAYREWAHSHGFYAESACAYELTEETLPNYMSDYDHARLWPINDWERIWINDKLTLNALVQDSDLARYVPVYYYYTDRTRLLPLVGSDYAPGLDGFLSCLRNVGTFACKPCNGAKAKGFHRLDYRSGQYFLDEKNVDEAAIEAFLADHRNYVFTEFLRPNAETAAINPLIHTVRVLVLNPDGVNPIPVSGYLRFACDDGKTGSGVNYALPTNDKIHSYDVGINVQNGSYGGGKLVYGNRVIDSPCHPLSGARVEGTFPEWPEVLTMLSKLSLKVGACEYLGFDVCLTDQGPKIMEINSHTGIKYMQVFDPVYKNPALASYFKAKLDALDSLEGDALRARNAIVR